MFHRVVWTLSKQNYAELHGNNKQPHSSVRNGIFPKLVQQPTHSKNDDRERAQSSVETITHPLRSSKLSSIDLSLSSQNHSTEEIIATGFRAESSRIFVIQPRCVKIKIDLYWSHTNLFGYQIISREENERTRGKRREKCETLNAVTVRWKGRINVRGKRTCSLFTRKTAVTMNTSTSTYIGWWDTKRYTEERE